MSSMDLTPRQKADRLLGKAINHSSNKHADEAKDCLEEAEAADNDLPYTAWRFMHVAKTCDPTGSEFRRYLELARHELEVGY